jgi:uncharacterized protein (TIGR02757 family)
MITKTELDALVLKYETPEFIQNDPVQFPHRFSKKEDIELAGFLASILAHGSRKVFIKKLDELFNIMQNEPHNFVMNFENGILGDFHYRFDETAVFEKIFAKLYQLYQNGNLEELFAVGRVSEYFGVGRILPDPAKNSAMKRHNMFLRWMVRKGPVDLGIWDFLKPCELLIPLDTHVARISREMGLLTRNSNDMKSVIELTNNLRNFDADDPVKYDFALFGKGVNGEDF